MNHLFANEYTRKGQASSYYDWLFGMGNLEAFEDEAIISTWAEQSYRAPFFGVWDTKEQIIVLRLMGESDQAKAVIDYMLEQVALRGDAGYEDFRLQMGLGWAYALSGINDKAKIAIDRAVDMRSEYADAWTGAELAVKRAAVLGWIGKKDEAVAELMRLSKKPNPYTSYYLLKHNLYYYPLRDHPGFKTLLEDPALKEPLPIKNHYR